jgi:hypothetical protein
MDNPTGYLKLDEIKAILKFLHQKEDERTEYALLD